MLGSDFDPLTAVGLFLLYIAVDMMYAYYTLSVTELRAVRSANIAAVMYLMLAAGVISYSHNPWYLAPIVAGSWVGTYVAVSLERRKRK